FSRARLMQDRMQCLRQGRISKTESHRLSSSWHDPLPGEQQFLRHLTEEEFKREARRPKPGRSSQRLPEDAAELLVGYRLRRGRIHWSAGCLVKQEQQQLDQIIQVNPREPLSSTSQRPAQPQAERWEHPGQCAAVSSKDHADARHHHLHAESLGGAGCCFPFTAEACEKSDAGWSVLSQQVVL